MAKINHPLFGYLGAFWIAGVEKPFYSLHEAKDYQRAKGGDVLDWQGNLLYPEPPPAPEPEPEPEPMTASAGMGIQHSGNWFTRLFRKI